MEKVKIVSVWLSLLFAVSGCEFQATEAGRSTSTSGEAVNSGSNQGGQNDTPAPGNDPVTPGPGGIDDVRIFIFGHSLIVHEHTPAPTEEKKVPHWLHRLAGHDGKGFFVDGQYGFLPQQADFSRLSPQWGFDQAPSLWTNENAPFSSVDYNHIMVTPANFIQYQSPDSNYHNSNESPVEATLRIYDQSLQAQPGAAFIIYENWPDMGGYGSFPDGVNIQAYHDTTIGGDFHQWFLSYHDQLLAARPGADIRMIPVGPVLSLLLSDPVLSGVPLTEFYEDDAPHGQPSLYFLASVVTYSALYKKPVPADFPIPDSVHVSVRSNFMMIRNTIWRALQDFNHSDGSSRVF